MSLLDSLGSVDPDQAVIRVYLVNGESRSLRFDERTDVDVSHIKPEERLSFQQNNLPGSY